MAIFGRSHIFQTIILGIYVSFRGGVLPIGNWRASKAPGNFTGPQKEVGSSSRCHHGFQWIFAKFCEHIHLSLGSPQGSFDESSLWLHITTERPHLEILTNALAERCKKLEVQGRTVHLEKLFVQLFMEGSLRQLIPWKDARGHEYPKCTDGKRDGF